MANTSNVSMNIFVLAFLYMCNKSHNMLFWGIYPYGKTMKESKEIINTQFKLVAKADGRVNWIGGLRHTRKVICDILLDCVVGSQVFPLLVCLISHTCVLY